MDGLVMSPPYGISGSNQGMAKLYEGALQETRLAQQAAYNRVKGTVASLINSYNVSESPGLRKQIANTMRSYHAGLPIELQKEIEPYIRHSPISKMEEKRRRFLEYNPAPREPSIPTGSWKENEGVWEKDWASYLFAKADHQRRMQIFMFNEASAPEKRNFLSLGNGKAAVRSKDGVVTVLDEKNLGIREAAQRLGLDEDKALQAVYLNNGMYPSGRKSGAVVNGTIFDYELDYDLLARPGEPQFRRRLVGSKTSPLPPEGDVPKDLAKFLGKVASLDDSDEDVAFLLNQLDNLPKEALRQVAGSQAKKVVSPEVSQFLSSRWPDYSINISQTDSGNRLWRFLDWIPPFAFFIDDTTGKKRWVGSVIKGKETLLPLGKGKNAVIYLDSQGIVRDKTNQVIGTNLEEARLRILSMVGGE